MERAITGFHRDELGDWVAELGCGHDQHVRHRPPFEERPWVTSAAGRLGRIGRLLACPLCDRAELPMNLRLVRTSPEWNEQSLPEALRRSHRLAAGTWGRILVRDGRLEFSMSSEPPVQVELLRGSAQAIPPEVEHRVGTPGRVRLAIDFLEVERGDHSGGPPAVASGGDPPCWAEAICPECGAMLDGPHRVGCLEERH